MQQHRHRTPISDNWVASLDFWKILTSSGVAEKSVQATYA